VMHKLRVRPLTPNKAIWKLLSAIESISEERLLSGGGSSGSAE